MTIIGAKSCLLFNKKRRKKQSKRAKEEGKGRKKKSDMTNKIRVKKSPILTKSFKPSQCSLFICLLR
jgi:hypothetical protein